MISQESLAYYVKDALTHLYDRMYLQTSPLSEILCPECAPGELRAGAIRRLLRETLESLKPRETVPFGQPEWISYRLISLRYMQRRNIHLVCDELGIGRSSYYRYHQQALDAITSVLWQQVRDMSSAAPSEGVGDTQPTAESAIRIAARMARESPVQSIHVSEFLEGVVRIAQPLADQQSILLELYVPNTIAAIYADPSTLRQALLGLLTDVIPNMAAGSLEIRVESLATQMVWHLHGSQAKNGNIDWEEMDGLDLARELFRIYGGGIEVEAVDDELTFLITLPETKQKTILIIDDDNDTVRLYSRWLEGGHYLVLVAQDRNDLERYLSRAVPDAVLLDVLMPQWDGWSVLQQLRMEPEWARIPVVVCSVLGQPRLALALGATAVLRKPISEELLLMTVSNALAQEDSQG